MITAKDKKAIKRRDWLKAVATLPVFGAFSISAYSKWVSQDTKKNDVLKTLNLEDIKSQSIHKTNNSKSDLIRIGIVGFGVRGEQIARALGYASPDWLKNQSEESMEQWLQQDDLNVAITGICDVFDQRVEKGIETSKSEYRDQWSES